jgi:hypothetical protein
MKDLFRRICLKPSAPFAWSSYILLVCNTLEEVSGQKSVRFSVKISHSDFLLSTGNTASQHSSRGSHISLLVAEVPLLQPLLIGGVGLLVLWVLGEQYPSTSNHIDGVETGNLRCWVVVFRWVMGRSFS